MSGSSGQQQQQPQGTSSYASIQIRDAVTKFSLYIQKLLRIQQQLPINEDPKCSKLVRLALQTFLKYSQSEQFTKQSFQTCKSAVLNKSSYYSLYIIDLMIKNSKYLIRQGRKQVESLFKVVWQRVYVGKVNEQKLENLRLMARCWGSLFGQRVQQPIGKWLQLRYGVKRIQLTQENERAFRQVYGDKKGDSVKLPNVTSSNVILGQQVVDNGCSKVSSMREELMNSLVEENGNVVNSKEAGNGLQRSISRTSQAMIAENAGEGVMKGQSLVNVKNTTGKETLPLSSSSSSMMMAKKPTSNRLQGVNKSLLQALDLQ